MKMEYLQRVFNRKRLDLITMVRSYSMLLMNKNMGHDSSRAILTYLVIDESRNFYIVQSWDEHDEYYPVTIRIDRLANTSFDEINELFKETMKTKLLSTKDAPEYINDGPTNKTLRLVTESEIPFLFSDRSDSIFRFIGGYLYKIMSPDSTPEFASKTRMSIYDRRRLTRLDYELSVEYHMYNTC